MKHGKKPVKLACGGYTGNAANNTDFLDLHGENVQPKDLPAGFTARGIVALVFSCVAGVLGCVTIFIYGMADIPNIEERVVKDLNIDERQLLAEFDEDEDEAVSSTGSTDPKFPDTVTHTLEK